MKRICRCCNQTQPETPEEKRVAREKSDRVRRELLEAENAWHKFYVPPPPQPHGRLLAILISSLVLFIFVANQIDKSTEIIPSGLTRGIAIIILSIPFAIGWTISYIRLSLTEKEESRIKQEQVEAFSTQFPEYANWLGFKTSD